MKFSTHKFALAGLVALSAVGILKILMQSILEKSFRLPWDVLVQLATNMQLLFTVVWLGVSTYFMCWVFAWMYNRLVG